MFKQRLSELKQRQLEIRLRDMELRAELRAESLRLTRPIKGMAWLGGVLGTVGLLAGMRRKRGRSILGWLRLALRVLRFRFSASSKPSSPQPSEPRR